MRRPGEDARLSAGWVYRLIVLSALVMAALGSGFSQDMTVRPSTPKRDANAIMERLKQENLRRANDLQRYSGRRTYRLEYRGLISLSADMVVDVLFEAPATKHFKVVSEHGSELLRDKVFKKLLEAEQEASSPENQRKTALSSDNYAFEFFGEESVADRHCYIIGVKPHTPSKFLYDGKIWVDDKDFAVVKIEAQPSKNPSFWISRTDIHHEYGKFGEFWLPVLNRSTSSMKIKGTATLTIRYEDYVPTAANSQAVQGVQ